MNIKEIKNKNYDIIPVKMKNDCLIKDIKEPLPSNYGFAMLLIGQPNSGKTTLLLNMIQKTKKRTHIIKNLMLFISFQILYTQLQKIYSYPKSINFMVLTNLKKLLKRLI